MQTLSCEVSILLMANVFKHKSMKILNPRSLFDSVGPLLLVVCAVKLLRFAFCNTAKQYLIITFTVFFFKYDYRNASETFLIDYFVVSILLSKVRKSSLEYIVRMLKLWKKVCLI